ncbi:MAG: imidazole glycerol phosphate synthase subunit HisH [Proteobacteria bacterium]|nr:imidazole glycerol phosphate synthase subunit HisH [Pseudomonadota bacterium]
MSSLPPTVAVIDYGAGNLRSVAKALERSGLRTRVTDDPARLRDADSIVLPGAGAFADATEGLRARGLDGAVRDHIGSGRPFLGLCLGLQLLFEESDEHRVTPGLGLLRGRVERFPDRDPDGTLLRVPHIGWNEVRFSGEHPMVDRLPDADTFYFVHGYRAVAADPKRVIGRTSYGGEFASAVAVDNVFAVQFHPEKSQSAGKRLLDAYRAWLEACL